MRLNSKVILSLASVMMMSECAWAMDKETDTASAGSVRSKSPEGPATAGAGATPVVTQAHYAMPAGVSPIVRTGASSYTVSTDVSAKKAPIAKSLPPLNITETREECDKIMNIFEKKANVAYALSCLESLNKKVNDPIYAPAKEDEGKALSELKHDILLKITEVNSFAKGHSKGFNEGHASGVNKGVQDCARNMLQKNMSWRLIMQITGLSYEELKCLSAEVQPATGSLPIVEEEDGSDHDSVKAVVSKRT